MSATFNRVVLPWPSPAVGESAKRGALSAQSRSFSTERAPLPCYFELQLSRACWQAPFGVKWKDDPLIYIFSLVEILTKLFKI